MTAFDLNIKNHAIYLKFNIQNDIGHEDAQELLGNPTLYHSSIHGKFHEEDIPLNSWPKGEN